MTIQLPSELESSILAEVANGRFASVDEALAEAWLSFQRQRQPQPSPGRSSVEASPHPAGPVIGPDPLLGSIGAMQDDAELLDEIVADAYRRRREEMGREFDLE